MNGTMGPDTPAMRLVLLGSPGSGKGTQAAVLAEHYGIAHISTGQMFREARKAGTELGRLSKSYTDKGNLVPDEVVIAIVAERLGRDDARTKGFLLDGYPRTVPQAQALDTFLEKEQMPLDRVIELKVDRDLLIQRLSGRRHCVICEIDYNVMFKPPRIEGRCDACGGLLVVRADDAEDSIIRRLDVDREMTRPLHRYYEEKSLLATIDGSKDVRTITDETLKVLASS